MKESEFEELRRLRNEVRELRLEKEILCEAASFRAGDDPVCRFRFVAEYRHVYGVKRLCRVMGISRSGFYAQEKRKVSQRATADARLSERIAEIYDRSRRTYGAPRVHAELATLGVRCGRKRVARLMKAQGLVGVHARKRWRRARPGLVNAPDLVRRNFNPAGPDQLWAADVTQFRTAEGWLYLATVIDPWSRRVVDRSTGTTPDAELVSHALVLAATRRQPPNKVVHHSDRGAADTSISFSQRIVELELDQSFGRTGDCYDNAVIESFWGRMQTELLNRRRWRTRVELANAMFEYLEIFHNRQRRHSALGMLTPTEYELAHNQSIA